MDDKEERRAYTGSLDTARDRRRPGRRETKNPWLINMMRGVIVPVTDSEPVAMHGRPADDLSAVKGILLGAAIGLVAWIILAFLVWQFLL